jgi:hypothetical protein
MRTLNTFEVNVIEAALTHLREMHDDLKKGTEDFVDIEFSNDVVITCEELLRMFKNEGIFTYEN